MYITTADNLIIGVCRSSIEGAIEVDCSKDLTSCLLDSNGKYNYKLEDNKVVKRTKEEKWKLSDYIQYRLNLADRRTYDALQSTDYIEIRQVDSNEPDILSNTELETIRAERREIRSRYRDLKIALESCKNLDEVDLRYKEFLAKF